MQEPTLGGGTYSKPSGGIPKTDLASAVQTSLGKADSALQSETDPTVPAWAKAASKPSYTASEVGLGNVGNFKAVSTVASQGLSDTEKSNARANIGAGTGNGTYSKPSGGIPKTDLASAVQTSLGKADTALQSETDPTVPAWAKAASKPSYTASEVGLGNVGNFKAVSTVASQGLSDTEKSNARTNIGAGTGNGTYSKPSGGIPKTDLASAVQTSLGKADSALQSETDPTVPSWAKATNKPSYTQDEVGDGTTYKRVSQTEKDAWNGKGTYSKPSGGIPKTDLASAVQTSLGKADSALQSHQTIKQDGITGATVNRFGTCSTAAATAAKTVSITSGTFNLEAGARVAVKFTNANTAGTPTLNVNSKGAKNIYSKGSQITTGSNKSLLAGTVDFIYDGTQWHLIGNYIDTNTTYSAATTSAAGLMSAADKTKLNGIAAGAQVNAITGVKGNAESSYRTGNVNLTPANIGAAASSHTHNYAGSSSAGGAATSAIKATTADKLKIKSAQNKPSLKTWTAKTWSGLTNFYAGNVWSDGSNIYYSYYDDVQYVLDKSTGTWYEKTWSGFIAFTGDNIWTDGTSIYYSFGSMQCVLNGSTWTEKTWSGLTDFNGYDIWTDGTNIYYSNGNIHYVLNGSTWTAKTWSGLTNFYGADVWTDGTNIYCSNASPAYVLDGSEWTAITGFAEGSGRYIWTDGTNIYYSDSFNQQILSKTTNKWTTKTWSGLSRFDGRYVWSDGNNIYYSNNSSQYVLTDKKSVR